MASTADSTVPYAVIITTAVPSLIIFARRRTSMPVPPGMRTSVTTTS
jgi:hypothetical protein